MLFEVLFLIKTVSIRKLLYPPTEMDLGITLLQRIQEEKNEEVCVVRLEDQIYVLLSNSPLDWKNIKPKKKVSEPLPGHLKRIRNVVFKNIMRLREIISSSLGNIWSTISCLFSKFRSKISYLATNTLSWCYKHTKMRYKAFTRFYKVCKQKFEQVLKVHKEIRD
ncbi:uncharacterized protein VNE69_05187 [Vairimorpha necatrix]|uniref:Uncharacterized protein n=1 Tax=Vairimorpha necatrix TaxID=6039 RepID=A0AAX4JCM5_9MICR